MNMARRNYLTVAILSLTWILSQPLPATAQSQHGVEVFPYGTVDLQLSASSGRALAVNRQRHSNSPFNHISLNLFTDIVAGDRLTVFNPVLGYPLMYHYFSSLRKNQLPANNADLLAHRGRSRPRHQGWRSPPRRKPAIRTPSSC
jgi:hypothetical protein